jgi:hypothetical protein
MPHEDAELDSPKREDEEDEGVILNENTRDEEEGRETKKSEK